MYLMINAYDVLDKLHVRVVGTDEVVDGQGEAMHVAWKSAVTLPNTGSRAWPDLVALVAEAVLDMAYDRP